jgi:hypothetical protein
MRFLILLEALASAASVDINTLSNGEPEPTLSTLLAAVNDLSAKLDRLVLTQTHDQEDASCVRAAASAGAGTADVSGAKTWCLRRGFTAQMLETDLNVHGNEGRTLLMNAAHSGNLVVADALIQAGAELNAKDEVRPHHARARATMRDARRSTYPLTSTRVRSTARRR